MGPTTSTVRARRGACACSVTARADLGGRSFLHSYDWRADSGFTTLELIITAPVVVASWINLQYFGSTTNNRVFGSGNKTLHNVVGLIGVLEGNGGDLRTGLPWQGGEIHEPVRLLFVLETTPAGITGIMDRNPVISRTCNHARSSEWANHTIIEADINRNVMIAGPTMPNQFTTSKSLMPDSASEGTSGKSGVR